MKGRDHLEGVAADRRIILKRILKDLSVRLCSGYILLKTDQWWLILYTVKKFQVP
jgi:hypothetical protein